MNMEDLRQTTSPQANTFMQSLNISALCFAF